MMPLLMLNRFVPLSIAGLLNDLASHWPSTSEDIRQTYKDSTVSSVLLLQEKQTGDISHFEQYCLAHAPEVHMSAIQYYIHTCSILGWRGFKKKPGTWQVVRNCFRTLIPKFHILILLFNLEQGL